MKRFMDWLSNSFAPAMQAFLARPWIAAICGSMQKILPFVLAGSLIFFYGVVRSFFPVLPDLSRIADYTFGMLGLITAFMVANQAMERLRHPRYVIVAGLASICVFLMFIKPQFVDGKMIVEFGRFGAMGILVGLLTGLLVSAVFNFYAKIPFLRGTSIPDFVVGWIHNIIPIVFSVGIGALIAFHFDVDVFSVVLRWFEPVAAFGQTLPGLILLMFIPAIFMSMGISSWCFNSIQTPIFMAGIAANIAAAHAGMHPTNIVTSEVCYTSALITMGGVGATLTLNILMLFSRSSGLRAVGRLCIAPSIFNINEPILFGGPVVFNPLLMLPMYINSVTGPLVVWTFMRSGWLDIPAKMIQVGQIPAPFSSVMITEDWRAILCYALLFVIYLATWYPFFRVYEKQRLEEERLEAAGEVSA